MRHLVRRFVGSLRARPLSPREESEVAALVVDEALAALFWEQPAMDQRHALESARAVLADRPGDRLVAQAALLHDIGKRHARLGVLGRVMATLAAMLRLPVPGRSARYLDHAALGAADLAAAGAPPLVVEYARHHDGRRPPAIAPDIWRILKAADGESHRLLPTGQYDVGDAEDA